MRQQWPQHLPGQHLQGSPDFALGLLFADLVDVFAGLGQRAVPPDGLLNRFDFAQVDQGRFGRSGGGISQAA